MANPVAIDLDPAPDGRGCGDAALSGGGISERRLLWARHTSTARLTAETSEGTSIRDASETPALALTIDLTHTSNLDRRSLPA